MEIVVHCAGSAKGDDDKAWSPVDAAARAGVAHLVYISVVGADPARLVELALGSPAGPVPDLAGPTAYGMDELVRSYLRATGKHRLVLPVRFAGGAYRAIRAGANLAPEHAVGRRTWEDFLADRVATATR